MVGLIFSFLGLVGAAQSCMFVRHTKGGNHVEIDYDTIENIQVTIVFFLCLDVNFFQLSMAA